jgi:hypothetical protein
MQELAAQAFRAKLAYFDAARLQDLFARPPDALARAALSGARDLRTHEAGDAFACSWLDGETLYVSVRGTVFSDLQDLLDDVTFCPTCPSWLPEGAAVHGGFLRHYERLRPLLEERLAAEATTALEVRYLGHSLGGAVATLAAYHALAAAAPRPGGAGGGGRTRRTSLLTFGAPRVGNEAYRSWCANAARGSLVLVTEISQDPVPLAPPWLAEPWWSERRVLRSGGGPLWSLRAHDIDVYIELAAGDRWLPSLSSTWDCARALLRWCLGDADARSPRSPPPPSLSLSLAHAFPARRAPPGRD